MCLVAMPFLALAQDGAGPLPNVTAVSVVRDKVIVPLSVNGAGPYPFILDLGIEHPVLSREIAATLKPDTAAEVEIQELRLGDAASKPQRALVRDLAPFKATLGMKIAGVFNGREIGKTLQMDLAANTLEVRPYSGDGSGATDSRSVRLRLVEHGQPLVSALIDGKHVRSFIVDTTFGGVMAMPERVLRDLGLFSRALPGIGDVPSLQVEAESEGAPDQASAPSDKMQIRLRSIRLGGAVVQNPVCSVLSAEESPRIGLGFLKNFQAAFDFDAKFLRLEPKGAMLIVCGPIIGCGLVPARFGDGYWVVWVAKDSPAAKANIRSGAQLLEVNGTDLKDASYAAVAGKLAAEPGVTLSVTVLQGGERRTIALAVQTLL